VEVRDPVHGSIEIKDCEIPILQHPFFQRLRNIKQLGFSEFSFPGATHTRYIHSIGVMHVSSMAFKKLFKGKLDLPIIKKFEQTLRMGCLLHDIGHAPLSHSTESAMPMVSELKLADNFIVGEKERQATHEDYTIKAIADSSFTLSFQQAIDEYNICPKAVAELVQGSTSNPGYFIFEGTNYFPILHQLVSSEIDCDRMDYLLRDSYFCGVSYGQYDLEWILENLEICIIEEEAFLGISERAVSTFDDFLLSRFHMFLTVYFHYRAVCLEKMLLNYFKSAPGEYKIPADIEDYQEHDDHMLSKVIRRSDNKWAKKIVLNEVPKKIFESFNIEDEKKIESLEDYLNKENIEFIKCSSRGRLSKYVSDQVGEPKKFNIKVSKTNIVTGEKQYLNIQDATDLFGKYSTAHSVVRIHCDLDELTDKQKNKLIDFLKNE
jgi:HD superfamily phosphohydrolase